MGGGLRRSRSIAKRLLRAAAASEFDKKVAAEAAWPDTTDCDRLDQAFEALNSRGVIALHNAATTMDDGISDVSEVLHRRGRKGIISYCFYHGQDVDRAVAGEGLMVAFGDLDDDPSRKAEVGRLVQNVLQEAGFSLQWDGDPETQIMELRYRLTTLKTVPGFQGPRAVERQVP